MGRGGQTESMNGASRAASAASMRAESSHRAVAPRVDYAAPAAQSSTQSTPIEHDRVEHDQVLQAARASLLGTLGEERFRRYFGAGTGSPDGTLRFDGGKLCVLAASPFVADVLARRFADELHAAAEAAGCGFEVRVDGSAFLGSPEQAADSSIDTDSITGDAIPAGAHTIDRASSTSNNSSGNGATDLATHQKPGHTTDAKSRGRAAQRRLNRYTLDAFVVGESNRLAYGAAQRIAESEGSCPFSPLFIQGPCGVGKTHLLQGIASEHRKRFPAARVRYTTAEAFTNGYIAAVRDGNVEAFRAKHRGLDLLCIDDVHFFGKKEQTQSELLHTLDAIGLEGAKIALASDEHPGRIEKLSKQLSSRFAAGAVVDLQSPDKALQSSLVRSIAERRGLLLEEAAADLIADRAARLGEATGGASVRDLEGMMTQIEAVHRLLPELRSKGSGVGLTLVRRALGLDIGDGSGSGVQVRPAANRRPVRLEQIRGEICRQLGVTDSELMGRGRHKRVVLARALFVELSRRMTTHSYPEVGRALARVNHSTVVTAHQRIRKQIIAGETVAVGGSFDGLSYGETADRFEDLVRRAVAAAG